MFTTIRAQERLEELKIFFLLRLSVLVEVFHGLVEQLIVLISTRRHLFEFVESFLHCLLVGQQSSREEYVCHIYSIPDGLFYLVQLILPLVCRDVAREVDRRRYLLLRNVERSPR